MANARETAGQEPPEFIYRGYAAAIPAET